MFLTLKVKYSHRLLKPLEYIDGKSDWIDLRCAERVNLEAGKFYMIPFGVAIKLPSGYEAHIVPRSSTFKKYGIIQTNGMGIIDNPYCGDGGGFYCGTDVADNPTIERSEPGDNKVVLL